MTTEHDAFFEQMVQAGLERAQDPEGRGRTRAERVFDDVERARRAEQREAERRYQVERDRLQGAIADLNALLWWEDHGHELQQRWG